MRDWLKKIRLPLTLLALALASHHTGLAGHLACEIEDCSAAESDQIHHASSPVDHDHCVVRIPTAQREDTRFQIDSDAPAFFYLTGQILPASFETCTLHLGWRGSPRPGGANFHFTRHVRLIS